MSNMKYIMLIHFHYPNGITTIKVYGNLIPRVKERYTVVLHNGRKYSGIVRSIENCTEEVDDANHCWQKGIACAEKVKVIVDTDTKTFVR